MAGLLPRPEPQLPGEPELLVVIKDGRPLWCLVYHDIRVCHASREEVERLLRVQCLARGLTVPKRISS